VTATLGKTIIVEHVIGHAPEVVWRALTEPELISRWLMANDFKPVVGHRFQFRAAPVGGWNGVTDSEVLVAEPWTRLSYSWNASGEQTRNGLRSTVTWTLEPTNGGTRVRMEHAGFRPEDEAGYQAMSGGWQRIVPRLGAVAGMPT
jgi:uncharacterized protein YndB with AHSA1/START domain